LDGHLGLFGCSLDSSGMSFPIRGFGGSTADHVSNSVIPLLLLLSRSKLVPDFGLTIHFLHLVVTTIYTRSFPTNLLWWALQAASSVLMVSVGVWACRYRELQPITFGGSNTAAASQKQANGSADPEDHVRGGRGRGRNRDEGPSYEMVGMKRGDEAV
jgi:protein SYS1